MKMRQQKHHTIARIYVGRWNNIYLIQFRRPSGFYRDPYPLRSFWK